MKSKLKEIVDSRGIKQSYICDRIGISNTAMSRLYRGTTVPTLSTALKIAKILEVPVEEIWEEDNTEE